MYLHLLLLLLLLLLGFIITTRRPHTHTHHKKLDTHDSTHGLGPGVMGWRWKILGTLHFLDPCRHGST
jgi:hypothetical protein